MGQAITRNQFKLNQRLESINNNMNIIVVVLLPVGEHSQDGSCKTGFANPNRWCHTAHILHDRSHNKSIEPRHGAFTLLDPDYLVASIHNSKLDDYLI